MFKLFQMSVKAELEDVIKSLESNRANNYKDNAQSDYKKLAALYDELKNAGKLNDKQIIHYEKILDEYATIMKGYTHKDQTPYWK